MNYRELTSSKRSNETQSLQPFAFSNGKSGRTRANTRMFPRKSWIREEMGVRVANAPSRHMHTYTHLEVVIEGLAQEELAHVLIDRPLTTYGTHK